MRELPPAVLDHLADTDVPDPTHGQVVTWDDSASKWVAAVPGEIEADDGIVGLVTLDAGTITYDDSGDDVEVTVVSRWGVDDDGPYFDDTNVVAGDEAALRVNPATSEFVAVPLNLPG